MAAYVARLRSLATANLAVLSLRLVQFFFAGIEVGVMGYYIKLETEAGQNASSPYVFMLVAGVITMLTQFIYCFSFYHPMVFFWDACIAAGWLLAFFWLLNFVSPLSCSWGAFNPFGSDKCGQTRAVLVLAIVLGVLWFLTALIGLWSRIRASRASASKA